MPTTRIQMKTSKGDITLELDGDKAPLSVANFLQYVDSGHFDNTIFHRVISNFMIQGGGFEPGMKQTNDLHSATSQFFINTVDNSHHLDGAQYCVFGKVVDGMDAVDAIRQVKTGRHGMHGDVPVEDVVIQSVKRL